jgi:hypothetical protein
MTGRHVVFLLATSILVSAGDHLRAQGPDRAAAPFVFLGTVSGAPPAGAAPAGAGPPGAGRFVVVDEIYLQKGTFENQTGKVVEVLDAPARLQAKGQYVFYTEPVRFGDRVVVRIVDVADATSPATASQSAAAKQLAADQFRRRELTERAAAADLVVSGTVVSVQRLERAGPPRDTEHDPDLRVARIKVEQALKGKPAGGEIEFVFAASRDVQWFKAPKFQIGDRRILFLQRPAPAVAALGVSPQRLTVLDPADARPIEDLPAVQAAIKAVPQ